jgi:23S rRNA (pseudouridine1915-N3)-methyltransferase
VRILVISATNRQPHWVRDGFDDYARRLDARCCLDLVEVPLAKRTRASDTGKAVEDESGRMLRRIPAGARVVALAADGQGWSTERFAGKLQAWLAGGAPICLLIGGPDGLGSECLARAAERWSLSPLTLPHGLVRVIVAEAVYRAWSLLNGHPYHRG